MKYLCLILTSVAALLTVGRASGQISIDEVEPQQESVQFPNELKRSAVVVPYFNMARYKAERAAIRKERNYLEIGGSLKGALTSHNDPWIKVSGGDNSIAAMGSVLLRHKFTKNLFSIETKIDAKFGYNRMKIDIPRVDGDGNPVLGDDGKQIVDNQGVWYKNQDEFAISLAPSFKMSKNWSYGSILNFRSQFVNGYISRERQEPTNRKSSFLSPGYLDISFGITYMSPKKGFPISINMSPIALSAVFVESERIRNNVWDGKPGWQAYGLAAADKTSKYEGGSSIQIDFDRTFARSGFLRYRTSLHSFFGWITNMGKENKYSDYSKYLDAMDEWSTNGSVPEKKPYLPVHPTVRWTNTLDIKATKYLETSFTFQLYYNRAQNVDVQTQMYLGVGLTYTFKNK